MEKLSNRKTIIFLVVSLIATFFAATLSILLGSVKIPLNEIIDSFINFDSLNSYHQIVREIRLPRALACLLVGAALAVSGAIMQGMTRNPIADSGILGINYGASFALALCFAFNASMNYSIVVLFSIIGAGIATYIVYGLSSIKKQKQTPMRLVLAGTTVGLFLSSLSQGVAMIYDVGQEITFWTTGSVAGIRMEQLKVVGIIILAGLIISILLSRSISLLSIGEESAIGLGLNIARTKKVGMLTVLLLSGSAVAIAGPIAFVGLICPHIVRYFTGGNYRKIIPLSILLGSILFTSADIISRVINPPSEISIGLIFAIIGVPFFLFLIKRRQKQ